MKKTDQLKRTLERLARIYNDGKEIAVRWTDRTPHASLNGDYIALNPESSEQFGPKGPDKLRLEADTACHEVGHIRWSDLRSKKQMTDDYPDHPTVAGTIANVFEDVFVDHTRTSPGNFPGLRSTMAWLHDKWHDGRPNVDSLEMTTLRYWEVMQQVAFCGNAKGLDAVADDGDDLAQFAGFIADRARAVREMDDPDERYALFEEVLSVLADRVDLDKLEQQISTPDVRYVIDPDYIDGLPEDLDGEPTPFPGHGYEKPDAESSGDWWDVPADFEAPDDPGEDFTIQYVALMEAELQDAVPLDDRIEERNKQLANHPIPPGNSHHHTKVRQHLDDLGITEDVVEFFRQFKQGDMHVPVERGMRLDPVRAGQAVAGVNVRDLYEEMEPVETGNRAVGVTVDLSGSMSGEKLFKAKTALGAFALATQEIGDDLVATGFTDTSGGIEFPLATAPDEDFEWKHLDVLGSDGGTPTAPALVDMKHLLDATSARQKIIIVLTDGKPNTTAGLLPDLEWGGSGTASERLTEVKNYVDRLRDEGFIVFGLGFGSGVSQRKLEAMFGEEFGRAVPVADLGDTLLEIYAGLMDVER